MLFITGSPRPLKRSFILLVILLSFTTRFTFAQALVNQEKLQYAREVEQKAIAANDSSELAEAYYLYGKAYVFAGDLPTAQRYFFKAIRFLEPSGASFELGRLYLRLADNEGRRGSYALSSQYVAQAVSIFKKAKSDEGLFRAYDSMAKVKLQTNEKNRYDSATYYFKLSEKIAIKVKDSLAIAVTNLGLGTMSVQYQKPGGIPYLQKALAIFTSKNDRRSRINTLIHLGTAYIQAEQYDLAIQSLNKAKKLFAFYQFQDFDIQAALTNSLALYYSRTNQWKTAYEQLYGVLTIERNQLSADRDSIINRLNIEFETQKREANLLANKKELQLNAQNIRIQRNSIITISTLLGVALVMSYILFQLNSKNKKISQQNVELVREQNHRVINNLQIVSSLLFLQAKQLADSDAKKAIEDSRLRIQSMSLIHQKLYNSNKAEVSLHEFITELTQNVLSSYNCPQTSVIMEVESITLPADQSIPLGLIITELLTNACKYAFNEHPQPALYIHCEPHRDIIHLNVIDNGLGCSHPNEDSSKKSFGMRLIRLQVEQLGGFYQFSKNIADSNKAGFLSGTQFSMTFKAHAISSEVLTKAT